MNDLADFLLARIAEDEAVAKAAVGKRVDISAVWSDMAVSRHIDRWSSARVLAECEAKRRIVEARPAIYLVPGQTLNAVHEEVQRQREYVFRLLALPYADHPDYRQEWAL